MPIKREFSDYITKIQNTNSNNYQRKSYQVENLFKPKDVDGKYTVVLRFLPSHPSEYTPFVENKIHMFNTKNGWFGCDCLGKFGKPCPICEHDKKMWQKYGREEGKNHVFGKPRVEYYSNILIVRNPNAPETEGKVFRFKYGKLIMDLLKEISTDRVDIAKGEIKGINPFDWKTGANFIFEGNKAGQFMKNDNSTFCSPSPINKWDSETQQYIPLTDEEIDTIEQQLYTLEDCNHKEENCKSYEQILESYKNKTGEDLLELDNNTVAIKINTNTPDSSMINMNTTPINKATVEETIIDNDDFFSRLSNS